MKWIERERAERIRRLIAIVGLSFALGALTDVVLTYRLRLQTSALSQPITADAGTSLPGLAQPQSRAQEPAAMRTVDHPWPDPAAIPTVTEPAAIPTAGAPAVIVDDAIEMLRGRHLTIPIDGVMPDKLHDAFAENRGEGRPHEALDIMAPRGTPVHAVEDGTVVKLFTSKAGGLTVYQFDPSGTFCYYYAHLDGYAADLVEGQPVRRGQVIGYVGSTGNASPEAPHLHFAVSRIGPERQWWKGEPLNPYLAFVQ